MKTRFMAALASCLLACVAQANTIQLDMTGTAYDGGTNTTTFFYNVILTGGNGTPGQTALFDVEGFTSASFVNSVAFGLPQLLTVTTGSPTDSSGGITLSVNNGLTVAGYSDLNSASDVLLDFNIAAIGQSASSSTPNLNLGVLSIVSNINKVIYTGYQNPSEDIKLSTGGPGLHLEDTGGPSANGVTTTPTPAAAMGGLVLLGGMSAFRRKR